MPVIITGAFAVLIANMVMGTESGLAHFKAFAFLADYQPIMKAIQYATLNFLTIGAVFLIGIELGRINGHQSLFPGILALMSYVSVVPTTLELLVNEKNQLVVDVLARQFSDPKSLFLGMIIAIVSVEIYCKLSKVDKLQIKMPDSVPSNVATSFSALIPSILTVTIVATFGFLFSKLQGFIYMKQYITLYKDL